MKSKNLNIRNVKTEDIIRIKKLALELNLNLSQTINLLLNYYDKTKDEVK